MDGCVCGSCGCCVPGVYCPTWSLVGSRVVKPLVCPGCEGVYSTATVALLYGGSVPDSGVTWNGLSPAGRTHTPTVPSTTKLSSLGDRHRSPHTRAAGPPPPRVAAQAKPELAAAPCMDEPSHWASRSVRKRLLRSLYGRCKTTNSQADMPPPSSIHSTSSPAAVQQGLPVERAFCLCLAAMMTSAYGSDGSALAAASSSTLLRISASVPYDIM